MPDAFLRGDDEFLLRVVVPVHRVKIVREMEEVAYDARLPLGTGIVGPIPMPVIIAFFVFLSGYILLAKTRVGTYLYALGENQEAALFSGIATGFYTKFVFTASGVLAALGVNTFFTGSRAGLAAMNALARSRGSASPPQSTFK